MYSIAQLEKQQVGLRLHKYLVEEIDEFTTKYSINRTDIIEEAIKSYLKEQKAKEFYNQFDIASKELKDALDNGKKLDTLEMLIDEI